MKDIQNLKGNYKMHTVNLGTLNQQYSCTDKCNKTKLKNTFGEIGSLHSNSINSNNGSMCN